VKTKGAGRSIRRYSSDEVAYSREFLERIARILVGSGHSPSKLVREFAVVCKGLREPTRRWDPSHLRFVADLPHVIAEWHSLPQYVDSEGRPIALPLRARGPSLSELIGRVLPQANPSEVIRSLQQLQALRRQGAGYVPADRYLAFNQQRSSALAHGLTALLGMLRTLDRNMTAGPGASLLERAAMNPRFPVRALPGFHRRLKGLAAEFLWSLDNDMRRREVRSDVGRTTRLGVGVFAFEEPTARRVSRGARRAQSARGAPRSKAGLP
jgi:hypothetical protein